MAQPKQDTISERLLIIETFVNIPPVDEFHRGYLFALMDEAVDDINEAGSEIVSKAIALYANDRYINRHWIIRRAKTIG